MYNRNVVLVMVEKKFFLESDSPLQEIGMRAQVISFLMAQGVKEGNAINDTDKKKVIVAIRAEDENKIKEIKNHLVQHLNKLYENNFCYQEFPSDIKASELMDLNNPHPVTTMPLTELSNSLMLEQTSKGVGAMKYLAKNMGAMATNTKELSESIKPLHALPEILRKLTDKMK